ncbi:26720_t:CDS:2, partial [Gigaspora margarita]
TIHPNDREINKCQLLINPSQPLNMKVQRKVKKDVQGKVKRIKQEATNRENDFDRKNASLVAEITYLKKLNQEGILVKKNAYTVYLAAWKNFNINSSLYLKALSKLTKKYYQNQKLGAISSYLANENPTTDPVVLEQIEKAVEKMKIIFPNFEMERQGQLYHIGL